MKSNKILTSIIVVAVVTVAGAVLYKLVIEPAQLKKEYLSCVKNAKTDDYNRWQEIERKIAEQKKIRNQAWKEVDGTVQAYKLSADFEACVEDKVIECHNGLLNTVRRIDLCDVRSDRMCELEKRYDIEKDAVESDKILHELNQELNKGGEIIEKELEDCEKSFKMFSKTY